MTVKTQKHFSRRTRPSLSERALGVQGRTPATAQDYFTNSAARTGWGTPSLTESTNYELVRMSYDFWLLTTLYRNHWISRRIVDTPANDMVKAWPRMTSDISPKDITKIDRVVRRTNTKAQTLTAMKWARLFGGAGCLIAVKGQEHELDQPLDLDTVPLGGYQGLIPFDRWAGISPSGDVCTDMDRPLDFGKPEFYEVRATGGSSFRVHASRILRFLGPTVPTPELEAQNYWGISVLEPVYEAIRKLDNMSWNILSLTFRANILGMKFPDLAALLSGVGSNQKASQGFESRMSSINHLISNQSLVPLPADGGIEATQYSFGGLGEVYQQFQLDLSGGAEIPVTRLWGRTITGLGQSNDADERIYEEKIATVQATDMVPQLEKLYPVICMAELGEVPDDMDLICPSVRVLDEKEKAELAKTVTDTVVVCLNSGIMSPRVAAKEIKQSSDATGVGTNLTDEFIGTLSDKAQSEGEVGSDLFGEEGEGLNLEPSSSPQKVLHEIGEENHEDEPETPKAKPTPIEKTPVRASARVSDSDGAGPERVVHGLTCVVETPKGYSRHGVTSNGKAWKTVMPADYGYIQGYTGADDDNLDCYIGPDPDATFVYVVDQSVLGNRKKYDEAKVMLAFPSQAAALHAYDLGHHRASDIMLDWTPMLVSDFKKWLGDRDPKKPCSTEVRV
jgi:phage-related protein (TIGR01555 family)